GGTIEMIRDAKCGRDVRTPRGARTPSSASVALANSKCAENEVGRGRLVRERLLCKFKVCGRGVRTPLGRTRWRADALVRERCSCKFHVCGRDVRTPLGRTRWSADALVRERCSCKFKVCGRGVRTPLGRTRWGADVLVRERCSCKYNKKGRPQGRPSLSDAIVRELTGRDVRRLQTLRALHQVELDGRTLSQRTEPLRLDCREVDEDVLSAFRRDEAKALRIVEPLDCAGRTHLLLISFCLFP